MYYDGTLMDMDTRGFDRGANNGPRPVGSGRMVLGRQRYGKNGRYASVEVDELTLWDNKSVQNISIHRGHLELFPFVVKNERTKYKTCKGI